MSMVPPTIEALMDIMEGSRDLSELLDKEVTQDVVDQTKGLVEQVVKQVCTRCSRWDDAVFRPAWSSWCLFASWRFLPGFTIGVQ